MILNQLIVADRNALAPDLAEAALVHQLAHGLEVRITIGHVGLDKLEHGDGGLVKAHKNSVVDLAQAEKLKDLAGLGTYSGDTTNTDHESELGLGSNEEMAIGLGFSLATNQIDFVPSVFLDIPLGMLEHDAVVLLVMSNSLFGLCTFDRGNTNSGPPSLQEGLGDGKNLTLGLGLLNPGRFDRFLGLGLGFG